jgi:hypothetical protein
MLQTLSYRFDDTYKIQQLSNRRKDSCSLPTTALPCEARDSRESTVERFLPVNWHRNGTARHTVMPCHGVPARAQEDDAAMGGDHPATRNWRGLTTETPMKTTLATAMLLLVSGCGIETATTAATTAKLQADQTKQAQQQMEKAKADIDAAMKQSSDRLNQAEKAGN